MISPSLVVLNVFLRALPVRNFLYSRPLAEYLVKWICFLVICREQASGASGRATSGMSSDEKNQVFLLDSWLRAYRGISAIYCPLYLNRDNFMYGLYCHHQGFVQHIVVVFHVHQAQIHLRWKESFLHPATPHRGAGPLILGGLQNPWTAEAAISVPILNLISLSENVNWRSGNKPDIYVADSSTPFSRFYLSWTFLSGINRFLFGSSLVVHVFNIT